MKRFRFPLDQVLRVSEARVKLLRQEMALETARRDEEKKELSETQRRYCEASRRLIEKETGSFITGEARENRLHLDRVAEEVALCQGRVKAAEEVVERCRERLVQARKREKSLQRLRERRLVEYQREALREAQKELDDVATKGFFRRTALEGGAAR